MTIPQVFDSEYKLMRIVWENAPLSAVALAALCAQKLQWKRTTTYTVLKRLCGRGILQNEGGRVTALYTDAQVQCSEGSRFLTRVFDGSLPSFIAAFTKESRLSEKDAAEIKRIIDEYEGGEHG